MFWIMLGSFVFFCLALAGNREEAKIKKHEPKSPTCPPHKWDYEKDFNDKEIMICKACRRRPSYEGRD